MSSQTAPDAAINRLRSDDLHPDTETGAMDVADDLRYAEGRLLITDTPNPTSADPLTLIGPHDRDQLVVVVHCRWERHGWDHRRVRTTSHVPTNAWTALDQAATVGTISTIRYGDVPHGWRDKLPPIGGWA